MSVQLKRQAQLQCWHFLTIRDYFSLIKVTSQIHMCFKLIISFLGAFGL